MRPGIVLLNMGSPASPEDVRRYLLCLFSDIDLIGFRAGRFLQPALAALIAALRTPRVVRRYRLFGGTSPLLHHTGQQADRLAEALQARGLRCAVAVGMRYSRPFVADAVDRMRAAGVDRIVGLPLYPQFSRSTTASSVQALREAVNDRCPGLPCRTVDHWYGEPGYHRALADRVRACRERLGTADGVGVLFLAHSVPVRYVEAGDPYVEQVEGTVQGVLQALGSEGGDVPPWWLAYQSQVGPVKWVGPTVPETLEIMLGEGVRRVIAVPVSFVSDHLETLYDIDLCHRRTALELGLERFVRVESLNAAEDFIRVLAGIVERLLAGEPGPGDGAQGEGETG